MQTQHLARARSLTRAPSLALLLALALAPALGCGSSSGLDSEDDEEQLEEPSDSTPPPPQPDAGARGQRDAALDARIDRESPMARRDAAFPSRQDAGAGGDGSAPVEKDGAAADTPAADGAVARADGSVMTGDAATPALGKKFVGNITTRGQVRSDFATMWNQITPENEGKWGSVEPVRDQMNWGPLDRIHDYAKKNGLHAKAHTFVWGSQQPSWLGSLSRAEQAEEVEEWIRLFCERYPDVQSIDVVNEPPPHTSPVYMAALGGAGASGYDWIVKSFQLAKKYCPKATLILNDYNTIEYGADNSRFIAIVKAIKSAGAPIDAVGAQSHDAYKHPVATVKQLLDKLANETALPVYITEYDINLANDAQQRQVMEQQFTMFWNHPKVVGITLWGYVAGATWLPNTGLMSADGRPRPALTWLLDFLKQQRAPQQP